MTYTRKHITFTATLSALLLMVACMVSCGHSNNTTPKDTTTSGMTTIYCDNSFENIMEQEIEVFEYNYPKANIMPFYVDEKTAIDSLMEGATKLLVTSRMINDQDIEYLRSKKRNLRQQRLAVDAIAIVVNNENTIEELSLQDIRDILTGKVKRWGEIEPTKLRNDSIIVVFDHKSSSITHHMRDSILHGEKFNAKVYAQGTPTDVFTAVEKIKNAVGLIGVTWVCTDMSGKDLPLEQRVKELNEQSTATFDFKNQIKVLSVRYDDLPIGKKPYQAYIFDGSYPLYRSLYVITTGPSGSLASGFYSFLTSVIGPKIILNTGILPASIHPRVVEN